MAFPAADKPEILANVRPEVQAPRVASPTLVILLGSSPAQAANEAKRQLRGLSDRDRKRIAFLYIDIDRRSVAESLQAFNARYPVRFIEMTERIEVPHDIKLTDKLRQASGASRLGYGQAGEPHTFIGHIIPESHDAGAGGNRNNGHTALCFNYDRVYGKIDEAINAITNLDNEPGATAVTYLTVHIVAFLGGGTGSGILPDIAVMVRQVLKNTAAMKHRINLFCMLPENLKGATSNLPKARSNAAATLLEVLALSLASKGSDVNYVKWFRNVPFDVEGAVADEIFLIGRSNMTSTEDIARIVGFDLAQRITDATGVGDLERSKCVDRHQLADYTNDWRRLLTMFSISCPVETCFPAEDMAIAFAQVAASKVLPLIGEGTTRVGAVQLTPQEREQIARQWAAVAAFGENSSDPLSLSRFEEFNAEEVRQANQHTIADFRDRAEQTQRDLDTRLRTIIAAKRDIEEGRIQQAVKAQAEGGAALLGQRRGRLLALRAEYDQVLYDLKRQPELAPERPPPEIGNDVVRAMLPMQKRGAAQKFCDAYNRFLDEYARATRQSLLEGLLLQVKSKVDEAIAKIDQTLKEANFAGAARELGEKGEGSHSWKGKMEIPHPHQRHLCDLRAFAKTNGQNDGVLRLFARATTARLTQADPRLDQEQMPDNLIDLLDYTDLTAYTLDAVTRRAGRAGAADRPGDGDLSQIGAKMLGQRVVEALRDFYMRWFIERNLFDLLAAAAPPAANGARTDQQITGYLADHLRELGERLRDMVDINPSISLDVALDKSIYIGMHVRDGVQTTMLNDALDEVDQMRANQWRAMLDPHRLQVAAGVHGFSLSNIRQLYNVGTNSMIADYLDKQQQWEVSDGHGHPVHSCSEMERLVWDPDALAAGWSLPDRIIRTGTDKKYSEQHPDGPGHGYRNGA